MVRATYYFIVGLDFFCNVRIIKLPQTNFQYWKMIFTHNFSLHGSTLWNNRVIVIKRKSLFKYDQYEKALCL